MFDSIQNELRKPAHYLSMRKREQAAKYIDKLEDALNKYSGDEIRLTHQSTIADQVNQIEALTQAIVGRDLILKQYMAHAVAQPAEPSQYGSRELQALILANLLTQPAEPVELSDMQTLWLWKNGDHMLAFDNLYPCYTAGGDPMTLGEPAARAIFRKSAKRGAV